MTLKIFYHLAYIMQKIEVKLRSGEEEDKRNCEMSTS